MTDTTELKRFPNGSIDLDHYVQIGRALHGQAVCSAAGRFISGPGRLAAHLLAQFSRWRRSCHRVVHPSLAE